MGRFGGLSGTMPETTPPNLDDEGTPVRTDFVRGRNALVARAEFGALFVDYYLHLGANEVRPEPEHDALFKRARSRVMDDPHGRIGVSDLSEYLNVPEHVLRAAFLESTGVTPRAWLRTCHGRPGSSTSSLRSNVASLSRETSPASK